MRDKAIIGVAVILAWLCPVGGGCGGDVAVYSGLSGNGEGDPSAGGGGATSTTSTGSTTSGSTSSTGTSSAGPCDVGNCSACLNGECAVNACVVQIDECMSDPECVDLRDCLEGCSEDGVCMQQCKQTYPAGVAPLLAMEQCLFCESCPGDCGTSPICSTEG